MKKISNAALKLVCLLLAVVLVAGVVPAPVFAAEVEVKVSDVSLDHAALVMSVGDSQMLVATINPVNATNRNVTWESSDRAVVTVDKVGKVTAVAPGRAVITVTTEDGGYTASCDITVASNVVNVTGIQLDKTELALSVGEMGGLVATVMPEGASNRNVVWTSSDETVATVDNTGMVMGVAEGTAIISATTVDGGKVAQCVVTVYKIVVPVSGIVLDKTELELVIGTSDQLVATVAPANADNQNVNWISTDETIATVDSEGNVTGVALGTTSVIAISEDGGKSAICNVTVVKAPVAVEGISLNKTATEIFVGEAESLLATFLPADATNRNVTWSSNDTSVATVDGNGRVTAVAVGVAVITVTTEEGKFAASCAVTVKNRPVTAVEVSKKEIKLYVGSSATLTAKVYPDNATIKDVVWSSSDEKIATVDNNGEITALKAGKATITVTSVDSGVSASCVVTVENIKVTGVTLDKTTAKMYTGDTLQLTATIAPTNATIKDLVWSSSDETVAKVDSTGKITALKEGTAVITVVTVDGQLEAVCNLTVRKALIPNPFTDVKETDYYYTAVRWAVTEGITSGTSADKFSPGMTCTRAQVVTFLWRAAGSPEPESTENPFKDVKESAYFYKAVLWAVENNITAGTAKGKFSPNAACTRAQVATFLWRANGSVESTSGENPFTDVREDAYYYQAVLWAVENKITSGTGRGMFSPNAVCTRGQIVSFLYRASEGVDAQ